MLKLKNYQEEVLETLSKYLLTMQELGLHQAKRAFIEVTERAYHPIEEIEKIPYICIKVPTGGGKTLIALHAVDLIYKEYLTEKGKTGLVLWFTPSNAIRSQTLNNLKDRNHPYREVLDNAFGNYVKVFDGEDALRITKNDIENYMCVVVETLQSFRRENTESLRNYRANGQLITHFEEIDEKYSEIIEKYQDSDEPVESLVNVIKMNNPLVVIDEGHNVKTDLSYVMIKELNPSFIIEYTATPIKGSNVLISIGADKLKAENMVKIPIYVSLYIDSWKIALDAAIEKRNELEIIAKKEEKESAEYIRPIMLIQSQNRSKNRDTITVDAVKNFLVNEKRIDEKWVSLRDSEHHEIDSIDLTKEDCEIRYIITVKALGEGWDCPPAYVLTSVAHKRSTLDVSQILGRILRLPGAVEKREEALNVSYVFTSSSDTEKTLQSVVEALQGYGYDEYALRKGGGKSKPEKTYFNIIADDKEVLIPLLAVKDEDGSFKTLTYRPDLVRGFSLKSEGRKVSIDVEETITRVYEVDITVEEDRTKLETKLFKEIATKINLRVFTNPKIELISEVARNIQFPNISLREIADYVAGVVDILLETGKVTLEHLYFHRYKLAMVIREKIQKLLDDFAKDRFENLYKEKKIGTSLEFVLPTTVEIFLHEETEFVKHYYERAYLLNSEERIVAEKLDELDNTRWWLRNIDRHGFYIQGYKKGRFFPDFLVKTKKNHYCVIEYKGEYLMDTEDTRYKVEIGNLLQNVSPDNWFFRLIGKNEIEDLMRFLRSI